MERRYVVPSTRAFLPISKIQWQNLPKGRYHFSKCSAAIFLSFPSFSRMTEPGLEKSAGIRFRSAALPRLLSIFISTLASYRTADNPLLLIKERYIPAGPSEKSLLAVTFSARSSFSPPQLTASHSENVVGTNQKGSERRKDKERERGGAEEEEKKESNRIPAFFFFIATFHHVSPGRVAAVQSKREIRFIFIPASFSPRPLDKWPRE